MNYLYYLYILNIFKNKILVTFNIPKYLSLSLLLLIYSIDVNCFYNNSYLLSK